MDKTLRDISETLWPKEEGKMSATCLYCNREFKGGNLFQHMWDAHREQMLKARRDREDCKSGPVSNLLGKHGGSAPRTSTLDNPDSLGDNVNLRPEDAAEQQAMPKKPGWPLGFMPRMPQPPVEDRLLTKMDRLERVVQKLQERRWDIQMALIEAGEGFISLATLRITKG
jgi:hypothetical protein